MTYLRILSVCALVGTALSVAPLASAQISQGSEYYTSNDIARDAFGEDYDSQRREITERRANARSISQSTQRFVTAALAAGQSGDYAEMIDQSQEGLRQRDLTPYEESVLYQIQAAGNLKNKDYSNAKAAYEMALATGGMNDDEKEKVTNTLSVLEAAGVN